MANEILIKDANNVTRTIHTIEDSTSAHYNMSIPINVSGLPIFVTAAPGIVAGEVSIAPQTLTIQGTGGEGGVPIIISSPVSVMQEGPWVVSVGAPLPAGTNHLGKVSVEGLTISSGSGLTVSVGGAVSAQAVPMAGTDGSNYRIPLTDTGGRLIVNASLGGSTAHIGRVSVVPDGGANLPVSVAGTVNVSANGGRFDVSVSPTQGNIPVSIGGAIVGTNIDGQGTQSSLWVNSQNKYFNKISSTWDRMVGTSLGLLVDSAVPINVSLSPTQGNIPVSIGGIGLVAAMADAKSNTIPRIVTEDYLMVYNTSGSNWDRWTGAIRSAGTGTEAVVGTNIDGQATINALFVNSQNKVRNRNSNTWDMLTGTSAGLLVAPVSLSPQVVTVHVCNALPAAGATPTVSIGGAVSLQAVQIAGRDTAGNARSPLMFTDGTLLVHVCNAAPGGAAGGGGPTVSVGGPVSVQAVPVAGTDGTDVRLLKTTTDGTLKSSGWLARPSYSFTRPTDVVAYALGDVVANSTVAGTVVPLSWPVGRLTTGHNSLSIRRAIMRKSGLSITNAAFRLHVFATAAGVSVSTGDNRVFTSVWSPSSKYAGAIDFIIDKPGSDGSVGEGMPTTGNEINLVLTSGAVSISGLLEARGAYTPLSGETLTITLECIQD